MTVRAPERYYPSITFVLTQAQYPLRLPAYRTSHRLRYHPYPRYGPLIQDDSLMTTVDYRYCDPPAATGHLLRSMVEEDLDLVNLDLAISPSQSREPRARRLSTLVIELAFVVRRNLGIIPGRTYLRVDAEAES